MTRPPSPTRHNPWPDYFARAAKEEIGIAIEFEQLTNGFIPNDAHSNRPEGYDDYTIVMSAIPNTIFIVKPGVRLD